MIAALGFWNEMINTIFKGLFWPLAWMDPRLALAVVSVLSGLVMLWAYKRFSNQTAIKRYKDRIRGNLFGVRLYQHDVSIVLRLQGSILRDTVRYVGLSMAPVAVLLIPITVIIIQVNYYFDRRPLETGTSTLIEARFDPSRISVVDQPVSLEGDDLVVETPPVRVREAGEVSWRVHFEKPGTHTVQVRAGSEGYAKRVEVGARWGAVSPKRSRNFWDLLLYPGEAPLSAPAQGIEVRHPPLPLTVWGYHVHWLIYFFGLSILAAFLLKGFFGVEL